MKQRAIGPANDNSALLDRQRERESVSLADGERQFRSQVERAVERGDLTQTRVGQWMLKNALEPLEQAIGAWLALPKKPGRPRLSDKVARPWIKKIGPAKAAYMTLKVVLDGIRHESNSLTRVCLDIAENIRAELRYRRLEEQAPALYKATLARVKSRPKHNQQYSLERALQSIDTSDLKLTDSEALDLGAVLVHLLITSTQESVVKQVRSPIKHTKTKRAFEYSLEATAEAIEHLTQRTNDLAILQSHARPMIVEPLPWAPGERGGYRFALRGWYPLVRHAVETKETKEWDKQLERVGKVERQRSTVIVVRNGKKVRVKPSVTTVPMPRVYDALNSIQNTAWRINRDVYALVRDITDRDIDLAGVPKKPTDGSHRKDHEAYLKTERTLDTAAGVLDAAAIWFPYSLDFRGRIYAIPASLSPQGDDLSRALLTFAHGKAVDADGERWLAMHGANCLGETPDGKVSKMTLDERVQWIHQHSREIIQVADNPFGDKWWAEADDPLQFFAFCIEWRNLQSARRSGATYVSSLPCAMDGSCNGLQHFSALWSDEIGGKKVNLVPQVQPQDMYQHVADVVCDRLKALEGKRDGPRWITKSITETTKINGKREKITKEVMSLAPWALASLWLGLHERFQIVDRKLTKLPTMTLPFGSEKYGFAEQVYDELHNQDNWSAIEKHFTIPNVDEKEVSQVKAACRLMATLIWETFGAAVVKAVEGRKWFRKCARVIVEAGRSPEWVILVTGFGVRQVYPKFEQKQVETVLHGAVKLTLRVPTDTRDLDNHKDAISPNIIHSFDAAALMLTVSQAAADGVNSFAVAHDSYATVAADCSVLARAARQAFVHLYSTHDMLQSLHEQFRVQGGDAIPVPPPKGTLDVNALLASDYVFA